MNDIYEYKARKYKYKYLKLKRKYMDERDGGGSIFGYLVKKIYSNKDPKPIKTEDKNKPIDHTQPASQEQKIFKQKLILLKESIINNIKLLYDNNKILGDKAYNLSKQDYNCILSDLNTIKCIIDEKATFNLRSNQSFNIKIMCRKIYSTPYYGDNMEHIYNIYKKIKENDIYKNDGFVPPILKWFFELLEKKSEEKQKILDQGNTQRIIEARGKYKPSIWENRIENIGITKIELFNSLKSFLSEKISKNNINSLKILKEFEEDFNKSVNQTRFDENHEYLMCDIFSYCILFKPYIKNIDYYSLTMYICKLYEIFKEYFIIVEDISKSSIRLPELFENFKEKFYDNSIDEKSFFEQLDLIISVIKE